MNVAWWRFIWSSGAVLAHVSFLQSCFVASLVCNRFLGAYLAFPKSDLVGLEFPIYLTCLHQSTVFYNNKADLACAITWPHIWSLLGSYSESLPSASKLTSWQPLGSIGSRDGRFRIIWNVAEAMLDAQCSLLVGAQVLVSQLADCWVDLMDSLNRKTIVNTILHLIQHYIFQDNDKKKN